ncbi:DNA polymerase IV [Myroides marinus]|uniref:DNA polymerase IV n=1 Tax=Myroides marinus TaxID=703342 RepID=UPI002578641A|nr:DNA polymerase IV [Myroides marinus]MDM1351199.1 DNA polymerase IV [Myroides marinus]MDM1352898.1 DNA polymerase IV [Myroides marinus]MDM1358406.1 DNA polymerase IV [Myroides marinus]MDM1365579.1 DNA polymerase IV [Myroides marinus]MDM1372960.1 DNA polymerase IV [Myroides marinus]
MNRKIIHVDMDAFYASVEQLDFPELRGKALAVGGSEERGVISAASYEARKFGVRSAMSGVMAKKNCPHLIFVKPRFERYKEVSRIIRSVFYEYTDLVEPLALDEAFLDVTENKIGCPSATLIAHEIRMKILERTGLTASAGISINKFLAKIASDYNKPNGQKTIEPDEVIEFLEELEIKKFFGIGKKTADKMYHLGIFTGRDLKTKSVEFLTEHFGKSGQLYYDIVRGVSNSPVRPNRTIKSVGTERTFDENLSSEIYIESRIESLVEELSLRLKKQNLAGKTITLKIKYSDFVQQTRSTTVPYFVSDYDIILDLAKSLLYQEKLKDSVRLIGVALSNLNTDEKKKPIAVQLSFDF